MDFWKAHFNRETGTHAQRNRNRWFCYVERIQVANKGSMAETMPGKCLPYI